MPSFLFIRSTLTSRGKWPPSAQLILPGFVPVNWEFSPPLSPPACSGWDWIETGQLFSFKIRITQNGLLLILLDYISFDCNSLEFDCVFEVLSRLFMCIWSCVLFVLRCCLAQVTLGKGFKLHGFFSWLNKGYYKKNAFVVIWSYIKLN